MVSSSSLAKAKSKASSASTTTSSSSPPSSSNVKPKKVKKPKTPKDVNAATVPIRDPDLPNFSDNATVPPAHIASDIPIDADAIVVAAAPAAPTEVKKRKATVSKSVLGKEIDDALLLKYQQNIKEGPVSSKLLQSQLKTILSENGISLQDCNDKGYTFGHTWIYRWKKRMGVTIKENPKENVEKITTKEDVEKITIKENVEK